MKKKIFIHIGFPKTGTTWIQDNIFSIHDEVGYIGKPTPQKNDPRLFDIKHEILYTPGEKFKAKSIRKKIYNLFREVDKPEIKIFGLSLETLTPQILLNGDGKLYVADRLKKIFPDSNVKIIIGIRNQLNLLPSLYSQYVKGGETLSLEQILFSPNSSRHERLLYHLRFYPTLQKFYSKFGKENVSIYLQEYLSENPEVIMQKITTFLDIDITTLELSENNKKINPKLSKAGLLVLRSCINPFFFTIYSSISPLNLLNLIIKPGVWFLNKVDRQNRLLSRKLSSEYNRCYILNLESELHNKCRKVFLKIVEYLDQKTFAKLSRLQYNLNSNLKNYISNYYRKSNTKLINNFDLPLEKYNYPVD